MLLRDEHDDRLRYVSTETQRGICGLCGHDVPPVPVIGGVVSETTEANQYAGGQGQAES